MKKVCLSIITLLSILSSCSHFSTSSDFLTELQESVTYVNLPYVNVTIKAQSKNCYDTLLPPENVYDNKYKKSDKITLNIEPSEGYKFKNWSCTPEDSVTFEDNTSSATIATIVSDLEPITITPVCSLIPKVIQFYPETAALKYSKDSVISVLFNTIIDASYFSNFNNITILNSSNININQYYFSPEVIYYEDKCELLIKPNSEKISELLTSKTDEQIYIIISLENIKNEKKESLFSEKLSFSFKIDNSVLDTKAPEFVNNEFKVFRTEKDATYNINSVITSPAKSFLYDDGDLFDEKQNPEKYSNKKLSTVGNTIWLTAQIKDEEYNNLQKVIVSEKKIGSYIDNFPEYKTIYTIADKNCIKFNPETNTYTFIAEYKFKNSDQKINDTFYGNNIRLKLEIYDGSSKSSSLYNDVLQVTTLPEPVLVRNSPTMKGNTLNENITLYFYFNKSQTKIHRLESIVLEKGAVENKNDIIIKGDSLSYSYDNINFTPITSFSNEYINKYNDNTMIYYPCIKTTINRDCNKTLYLKLSYSDIFGNHNEITKTIPKNITVCDAKIDDKQNVTLTLSETPNKYFVVYYSKNDSPLKTVYGKQNGTYVDDFYVLFEGNSVTFPLENTSDKTDGIYNFYVVPTEITTDYNHPKNFNISYPVSGNYNLFRSDFFDLLNNKQDEKYRFYKDSKNSSYLLLEPTGTPGDSYPLFVGVTPPSSEIPDSAVPSSFTLTQKSNGINSASYTVTLTLPSGFKKNSNFFYRYKLENTTDNKPEIVSDNSFVCKSGCTYNISVIVKDKYGNEKTSNSVPLTLDSKNVPPTWDVKNSDIEFQNELNKFYLKTTPETNNGFEYRTPILYYFDTQAKSAYEDFINSSKTFNAYFDNEKYEIYYNGEIGDYVHFLIEDKIGNYTIKTLKFSTKDTNSYELYWYKNGSSVAIRFPDFYSRYYDYFESLFIQEFTDNSWSSPTIKTSFTNANPKYYNYTPSRDSFIKIVPNFKTAKDNLTIQYGDISYIHPKTIINETPVVFKSVINNGDEYIILSDTPVFVHTIQSIKNFGSDNNQDWEKFGIELKAQYSKGNLTYEPPSKSISSINGIQFVKGYYYVTIVYFADGTYKILDVNQK